MRRPLRFLLVTTIVAAIPVRLAAAAPASEDVPIPGGRAALAATLGIDPVPDRARFVSEVARLVHGLYRKAVVPEVLAQELRRNAASTTEIDELVPVPLTAAVWSDAIFLRAVSPRDLVFAILGDRQAAFLCHGLAALDDDTLQYLGDHPFLLKEIYTLGAAPFTVFSSSLRVQNGRVVPPGGDEAVALWEAIVGEPVARPERFIVALFTQAAGRLANLYDTIGHLDRPRQRFALGLWMSDPSARLNSMRALAVAAIAASGDWRNMQTQPFARQPYDLSAMLMRVDVDAEGRPTPPASRGFWSRVIESPDLPEDPARLLRTGADDRPFDAAWLAGLTTAGDIRVRAERLDQFAFGQRVFAGASPAEMPDVFVATRAFRRYRMLMVAFERMGIRSPKLYAASARLASRMSPQDSARSFVATAQFQGALALLWQMHGVGTLDAARAEALVISLLAVPLNSSSQYLGGILRWLSEDLRAAIPPAYSLEAAVQAAVAGPDTIASAPRIEWEGQRYRVDLSAAERRRLERVREKQSGVTLDLALELAAAARTLAPQTLDAVQRASAQLKSVAEELSAESRREAVFDSESFPPGVVPPPSPLARVLKAMAELDGIGGDAARLPRAARAAVEVVDAADEAAAQALVSLVYAINIGDPDGDALLPADVSRRHDFGLGQRDNDQRLRAPWMTPRQDVSPGVPWHVDGSLLGMDIALATVVLRRLSVDRALDAPTLTSNERETFAIGFGLLNPFTLTDAARDAIAEAVETGRKRVALIRTAAEMASVADELQMDGWRRRATRWTLEHEPGSLELFFSLGELLALGGAGGDIDLDPWGTSAMVSTGCVCTRMPSPGRLPLLVGRRQIGLLATAVPDLNLHVARMLAHLRIPARLAKYVLSAAVQDFVDEVRGTDPDDWLSLVRGAAAVPLERIEDYVAAAAADGPLVPDSAR